MIRAAAICIALWTAAAWAGEELPPLRYQPDATVTWESGMRGLQELGFSTDDVTMDRYPYPHTFSARRPTLKFKARYNELELTHGPGADPAVPRRIPYEAMTRLGVVGDHGFRGVSIDGKWYVWCVRIADSDRRESCARALANYLYALRERATFIRQSDVRFQEALAKYGASGSRPELPEEARRFKVQAELAVSEKRFVDAISGYVMSVRAAPWWAEGYYNLALLNGELKVYEEAVRMMKRFLALEPRSPLARAAQDQIYRWEALDERR
jgi:hypothetical protein